MTAGTQTTTKRPIPGRWALVHYMKAAHLPAHTHRQGIMDPIFGNPNPPELCIFGLQWGLWSSQVLRTTFDPGNLVIVPGISGWPTLGEIRACVGRGTCISYGNTLTFPGHNLGGLYTTSGYNFVCRSDSELGTFISSSCGCPVG
jgi:hypothetical protein